MTFLIFGAIAQILDLDPDRGHGLDHGLGLVPNLVVGVLMMLRVELLLHGVHDLDGVLLRGVLVVVQVLGLGPVLKQQPS